MARKAARGQTPKFSYNTESRTATRLATLMDARDLTVNSFAKELPTQRRTLQRWLDGQTILLGNRRKLGEYFGVPAEDFAPDDKLAAIRPLLEELEKVRKKQGLSPSTIAAEVRRLAR